MTTTYNNPAFSEKDEVRFLLQDVGPTWLLQDEEIQYAIDKWTPIYDSPYYVASVLASIIASRYAGETSYSADGVSINMASVADQYRALAASLRESYRESLVGGFPDVGGITPGEGLLPGTKGFNFGTGMHDNPEAGEQDYGGRDPVYYPDDIGDYPVE
jgi:hypothetical protein